MTIDLKAEYARPGCTCELEQGFGACESYTRPKYCVIDAECVEVCYCKEEKHAEMIAWALSMADNGRCGICRIHTKEWWDKHWEEVE